MSVLQDRRRCFRLAAFSSRKPPSRCLGFKRPFAGPSTTFRRSTADALLAGVPDGVVSSPRSPRRSVGVWGCAGSVLGHFGDELVASRSGDVVPRAVRSSTSVRCAFRSIRSRRGPSNFAPNIFFLSIIYIYHISWLRSILPATQVRSLLGDVLALQRDGRVVRETVRDVECRNSLAPLTRRERELSGDPGLEYRWCWDCTWLSIRHDSPYGLLPWARRRLRTPGLGFRYQAAWVELRVRDRTAGCTRVDAENESKLSG